MNDVLPDVLDSGLILVFCGTAASAVSAQRGAYYANSGNYFWRTLHTTGVTSKRLAPSEFGDLLKFRIGLTDVAKGAAGADAELRYDDFHPGRLRQSVCRYQPQILAFTSKRAWRAANALPSVHAVEYGWQDCRIGATRLYVLPSPSGAARRYWNVGYWQALANEYRRLFCANTGGIHAGLP